MNETVQVLPLSFDLSALLRQSVATFYSHLVTRPTGQALRLGIESQIGECDRPVLSILDFTQVVVLDYSCADETVAKLLLRYQNSGRTTAAYFLARGVGERHREPIEAVLHRHGLALGALLDDGERTLLGQASPLEAAAWTVVDRLGRATPDDVAAATGMDAAEAATALDSLARRGLLFAPGDDGGFYPLSSLLRGP